MKKIIKKDKETLQMLKDFKAGKFVPVENFAEMKSKLTRAAKNTIKERNTLKKDTNINFRISSDQLNKLKGVAENEGLPYQSYLSLVINQITSGKFKIKITQ